MVAAVVGVYGVLLHLVAERRRELGVRVALGASPGRLVLREARGLRLPRDVPVERVSLARRTSPMPPDPTAETIP
jgi:hypothetical protein